MLYWDIQTVSHGPHEGAKVQLYRAIQQRADDSEEVRADTKTSSPRWSGRVFEDAREQVRAVDDFVDEGLGDGRKALDCSRALLISTRCDLCDQIARCGSSCNDVRC